MRSGRWIAGALAATALGYVIGKGDPRSITLRSGTAYASVAQATVATGGWVYDIPVNVDWVDSGGMLHLGGRPSCLPANGQSRIEFGTVDVSSSGLTQRDVVWVRCPPA